MWSMRSSRIVLRFSDSDEVASRRMISSRNPPSCEAKQWFCKWRQRRPKWYFVRFCSCSSTRTRWTSCSTTARRLSSTGAGTGASLGDRFRLRVRERLGLYTALRGEYRSSSSAAGGLLAVLGLVLVWRIGISGDLPCVDELEVLLETPLWRFQRIPQALQRVRAPLGPSLQQGVSAVPHSEHLLGISVSTLVVNQSNYFASGF
mmetsp:Transcript_2928/g.10274  ORF Transcript_2928/g.10274 Transcript_2928/m.10274 type:complete len:204 (+) Transcript_2928:283-894(+)